MKMPKKCRPPFAMPFMFEVHEKVDQVGHTKYLYTMVKIAYYDLTYYHHMWWGDAKLKDMQVLQPDIDITFKEKKFKNNKKALKWIKRWWKRH
jgi:hypothetical protein